MALIHENWCVYVNEMYRLHTDLNDENSSEYYYTLFTGDYIGLTSSKWFATHAPNEFSKGKNTCYGHKIWLDDDLQKGTIRISRVAVVPKKYKLTFYLDAQGLEAVKKFIGSVKGSVYEGINIWDGEELEKR